MNVSTHFTLEELTRTSTCLANEPTPGAKEYLKTLADALLEPIRELLSTFFP